eukprot:TRINITY_DN4622_c0_g1_i1.p1 TRINITY_DN4622_c0_g1~~TRINITY_DN4622_c0_g1_i1.p1  ORF type:complete len:125 (-),score=14.35 TRINITY_DN4622_c0_g1_i1:303-677(-)
MMLKKGLEDIIEYILEHISSTTMLFYASSLIEIICNNDIQYNRGVVNRIVARGTIIKLMRGLSISTIKAKKADTIFAALCIIINMSYGLLYFACLFYFFPILVICPILKKKRQGSRQYKQGFLN